MSKQHDILVQTVNRVSFSGQQFEGLDHFHTKAEFLKYMATLWDTVTTTPNIQPSVQLTNMERC